MKTNRWLEGFVATATTRSRDAWTWVAGAVFGILFLVTPLWLIEGAAMQVGGRVDAVKEGSEGRFVDGVGRLG